MAHTTADIIIIGAGIMGAAAAWHATRAGARVLIVDQFAAGHANGSSHGDTRIIRYAYDHAIYIDMARRAFPLWRALESEYGQPMLETTGMLDFGRTDNAEYQAVRTTMIAENIPFEVLDAVTVAARFPGFCLPSDEQALYQPDAGYIHAGKSVAALLQLAQARGAILYTETAVQRVVPTVNSVTVETAQGSYSAGSVIITAGAWINQLLASLDIVLPLKVWRQQVLYFNAPDPAAWQRGRMPIFLQHADPIYYGIPDVGDGVKVAVHKYVDAVDPNNYPNDYLRAIDPAYREQVQRWTAQYLPTLGTQVNKELTCLYTMTPHEHFIVDQHPSYPHVVFASPCSGHGFKFGVVIGKILVQLAHGEIPDFDLALFRMKD